MKNNSILIGSFLAIIISCIIIFAFEYEKSFFQIIISFLIFIFPITFIQSLKSKTLSFLFVLFTILFLYFCYKFDFKDVYLGLVMSILIGVSINYFKVSRAKTNKTKNKF